MEAKAKDKSTLRDEGDPFLQKVREAPPDDEPVSTDEEDGAREAREELDRGEAVSHEEMKREFDW